MNRHLREVTLLTFTGGIAFLGVKVLMGPRQVNAAIGRSMSWLVTVREGEAYVRSEHGS